MGKIVLKKTKNDEFHFSVVANNNEIVAQSETYKEKQGAMNGIKALLSVLYSPATYISDETAETPKEIKIDFKAEDEEE